MPDINNSCLYRPSLALWTENGIVAALQTPSDGHYMKVFLNYFVSIVYFMYPFIKKPSEALPSWVYSNQRAKGWQRAHFVFKPDCKGTLEAQRQCPSVEAYILLLCLSFRFESKLLPIMEHFHTVLKKISSRIRAEQFKVRVCVCIPCACAVYRSMLIYERPSHVVKICEL